MAQIRGFTQGTVILFSTPGSQNVFPDNQPPTTAENNQPASEATAGFPQICGLSVAYSGPLTPEMGEMWL